MFSKDWNMGTVPTKGCLGPPDSKLRFLHQINQQVKDYVLARFLMLKV